MSPENFVKAQVAEFVRKEAEHCGGYLTMLAVACVLRNRVKKGWFGGDWMEVLSHAGEVSALTPRAPDPVNLKSGDLRRVLAEIDDIFLGLYPDQFSDGKGLYYMDLLGGMQHGQEVNPWFAEKIIKDQDNHRRIAQVGMLQIYS